LTPDTTTATTSVVVVIVCISSNCNLKSYTTISCLWTRRTTLNTSATGTTTATT
jgi:hypothetical protein